MWLRPHEIIEGPDGSPLPTQPDVPHGGFAYLFHDNLLSKEYVRCLRGENTGLVGGSVFKLCHVHCDVAEPTEHSYRQCGSRRCASIALTQANKTPK